MLTERWAEVTNMLFKDGVTLAAVYDVIWGELQSETGSILHISQPVLNDMAP